MIVTLIVAAIALTAVSGVPESLLSRRSKLGERVAALLMGAGSACGIAGAIAVLASGRVEEASLPWQVPYGELAIRIDGLSAMFLAQIFFIAPLAAIYGLEYWPLEKHPKNGRKLRLFFGALTAAMGLLVVARNTVLFLAGWEIMALAAFFVLTTDDESEPVRQGGFVYLVAARMGTLCLFAMFAALHVAQGAWSFAAPGRAIDPSLANAIFLLAVVGFGLKAGLMPMHAWLPGAHANAPSHVSAIMSGVLLKMGIYGILRVCSFFEHPPMWWGVLLLTMGIVSGVLGVAFAIGQHDIKRLLAYHSVENIGIITMGIGVAVIGRSIGEPALVALGLAGALLHVWNHGLFKALLFLCAGSVLHATGTREIDLMGGLAKKMPRTALAFLVGAVAICGLPPLNGFISELFVYLGLFRATMLDAPGAGLAGALGAPALALIGALAVACFVKVFGAVFLGTARSDHGKNAHESGLRMIVPMAALGLACVVIGVAPRLVVKVLDRATLAWAPELSGRAISVSSLAPLGWLSITAAVLVGSIAAISAILAKLAPSKSPRAGTWDCGYAAPSQRMQYTASSFAELLVGLFSWVLRPHVHRVKLIGPFPQTQAFESHVPDLVLDVAVLPASLRVGRALGWFRWVQHGSVHLYIVYVLIALILALLLQR